MKLNEDELLVARVEAQGMPTGMLADHFSQQTLSAELPGPGWLSPEEFRACWTELVNRGYLTAH